MEQTGSVADLDGGAGGGGGAFPPLATKKKKTARPVRVTGLVLLACMQVHAVDRFPLS